MTSAVVGYQLRNISTAEIIQTWGGTWGQVPGVPALLIIPQGEGKLPLQVCGPKVGDIYSGYILETFSMDEPPAPIVDISDRQFFQQAAIAGFITEAEAMAAVQTGAIPTIMQTIIDAMPSEQQFAAKMIVAGATIYQRNHPLTSAFGTALNQTTEQLDAFFRAAALL